MIKIGKQRYPLRSYLTLVDGEMDLLPYFVRYQRDALGVDEIFVIVFGCCCDMKRAKRVIVDASVRFVAGARACPPTSLSPARGTNCCANRMSTASGR